MPYIYSTLTCDNLYGPYSDGGGDLPVRTEESHVLVKGGAGVANDRLDTPLGVATQVTDAQLTLLQADPVFALHLKNGFVTIDDKKVDPEVKATDMASRDKSAPLVPQDYTKEDDVQPVVNTDAKPSRRSKK